MSFNKGKREGNMIVADKDGNIRLEVDYDEDPYGVFSLGEENRKLKEKVKQLTKKNKELKKVIENYKEEFVRVG
jgi:hypothetical protein